MKSLNLKNNINVEDLKIAGFTCVGSILGINLKWIPVEGLGEAIVVALISTAIGYFGNKLLKYLDFSITSQIKKIRNRKKA